MDLDSSILLSIFLVVFLMISSSSGTASFPIALPGCEDQDHCGDVSIPFPFGTRKDCYLNEGFFINCSSSSDGRPPKPLLGYGTIAVKDISTGGRLRVLYDIAYDCYDPKNNTLSNFFPPWMTLAKPFVFNSTANKFTAIGCDTYALVEGASNGRIYTTGCMSVCGYKEDVESGSCSGIGCCQTSIPRGAWEINVTVDSYYNHTYVSDFNPCSYGFVVEEAEFKFYADNLTNINKNSSVPAVVDWVVAYETCEVAKKTFTTYACKTENSVCYDQDGALGYRCKCKEGFEGNCWFRQNLWEGERAILQRKIH